MIRNPKTKKQVGFLRLRVAYKDNWNALKINMEPHFLPFEEGKKKSRKLFQSEWDELARFQENYKRWALPPFPFRTPTDTQSNAML